MKSLLGVAKFYPSALAVVMLLIGAANTAAAVVDNKIYARLPDQHVAGGVVDAKGYQSTEAELDRYLELPAAVDPAARNPADRFAFYANDYNARTIKLIRRHYPGIESIKETGSLLRSPWKKRFVKREGRMMTLDEIEHDTLRAQYRDPRIHFAVNCASKGCPPLFHEPFEGRTLEDQLNDATRRFINDPDRYRLDAQTLYPSKIFDWYGEDLNDNPVTYFLYYAQGDLKTHLAQQRSRLKVDYLDYDWSLNGR
ncbi:MAG: DUF547 domain-containing protein [Desulfobacterales bacterium]|nr:DUF547 domain-containing protein [Desulfobacterales bacterium]